MCRWLAYSGRSVPLEAVLFQPEHSLIEQSLNSRLGHTTTNGDGFGVGWYGRHSELPFRYRSLHPAWSDTNLREAARAVRAPLFVAHVRAATGTPTQETNCHPFRFGRWLFVHNGMIRQYSHMRRELMMAVAPHLFRWIEGSTDSEVMFFLALTFGLERDPRGALEQMAGLIEEVGRRYDVEEPLNMTVCVTDGEQVVAVRYSSEGASRSLFHSTSFRQLRALYPEDPRILAAGDDAFLVLSEPLIDVQGVWEEIPEATILMAKGSDIQSHRFVPRPPASGLAVVRSA
ncbi:class II glutamine amidotransferase [Cupriavidus respiraculi]|uniref:Gamma-glutamyl-hercynylcysteine sulfoxide hydrolase n=1 Tax=Cupriavidus respiraculi TaxID=195930 RepID=A0ABN7Z5E3_9BURK|nr:class II glutamine amidotransferase [Cupriavidus respiraculi]CAG9179515.1 Gamma-glutamyl-hercynylcysteine sulfoxide hydrolase [Cupriavidus respiraculi]